MAELFFNKVDKLDSTLGFEMSLIVVEAIRERCASFMILTATVSEIFGAQTNSSILVVEMSLKISPGGKNPSGRTIIVAVLYDVSLPFHPYQVTPLELGEDGT